jgi:uncharacterized protein (TIGR02118 family)
MYKAVGVWTWPRPEDEQAFEEHYVNVHVRTADAVPGVERLTLMKAGDTGRDSGIYRVAEMYFPDEEAFAEAADSEGWAGMVADATAMIERFGVELKAAHGWESENPGSD